MAEETVTITKKEYEKLKKKASQKQTKRGGVDLMLEAIRRAPRFNWREAWEEVLEERKKEHR